MNIIDFIETHYPIINRVRDRLSDPYKLVEEMDDLPYDAVGPNEEGVITKLVEIEDGVYMPVLDLICMVESDFNDKNKDLYEVWKVYMSQVEISSINLVDIKEAVRTYKAVRDARKGQLDVLSSQED